MNMRKERVSHCLATLLFVIATSCTDAASNPIAPSTAKHSAMDQECVVWMEGCPDIVPTVGGGGGTSQAGAGAAPTNSWPSHFTVVGTRKGHPYEATAFREGWFSSTYEAFFLATDGSGCSGYLTIDLSIAEAASIYFGRGSTLSSYSYSSEEGCAN